MSKFQTPKKSSAAMLSALALLVCTGSSCPSRTLVPESVIFPGDQGESAGQLLGGTAIIAIQVKINDGGPYNFIVDTGAATCLVTPRLATDLPAGSLTFRLAGIGATLNTVTTVEIDTLETGNVQFKNFLAVVGELPFNDSFKIEGILGLPAFHNVTMSIDYPLKKLRVLAAPLQEHTCNAPISGGELASNGAYSTVDVDIIVAGRTVKALIDTGSDGFLGLPQSSFSNLPFTSPLTSHTVHGIGGKETSKVGSLSGAVKVACRTYQGPQVDLHESELINLGAKGWRSSILSIDQRSKLMRLETLGCSPTQDCIEPDPGYRVYTLTLPIFNDDAKQLEVLEAGSENLGFRPCDFANGWDCTVSAVLVPISEIYPTREQAVSSICSRVSHLWDQRALGLPAAVVDEIIMSLGFRMYELLDACPGLDPSDGT